MSEYCEAMDCHAYKPCSAHHASTSTEFKSSLIKVVAEADKARNDSHAQFSVNQIMHLSKQIHGSRVCTVDHETGTERTYNETVDRVARLGTAIRDKLRLPSCGRVAIIALNSFRYFEALFAVSHSGGWVVPINIRLAAPEIAETLNDCETEMVLLDNAFVSIAPHLRQAVPSLKTVVLLGAAGGGKAVDAVSDTLIAETEAKAASNRCGDDVYGLFYTGGTTGKSKGVMTTHANIVANAYGCCAIMQVTYKDRWMHAASMFHAADQAGTYIVTMMGGSHYFVPKFVALDVLKSWSVNKLTISLMVPTMFAMLSQHPEASNYDMTCTRTVMYGGSPMPDAIRDASVALMGQNCRFVHVYGMTEATPLVTMFPWELHVVGNQKMGSAGLSVPHCQIKIVDEQDNELPPNTVGEICVRGPHVMKGYFNLPERSKEALKGGWYHTGDGGILDEDGFLFIKDRVKDMIITGGENVYSAEVENCISKFPGVAMNAVIGVPDSVFVERILAIVVPTQGACGTLEAKAIIAHCHGLIAGYKCPKEVVIRKWDDILPLSGAGKVLKTKLREPYWQDTKVLKVSVYAENQTNGVH